jgi:hypothetical protein
LIACFRLTAQRLTLPFLFYYMQLKVLLARRATQERHCGESSGDVTASSTTNNLPVPNARSQSSACFSKRKTAASTLSAPLTKKAKLSSPNSVTTSHNFLQIGARKAMEAKSARHAARVGYDRSKANKKSHTGSNVPLSRVLRV